MGVPSEPDDRAAASDESRLDTLVASDGDADSAEFWLRHLRAGLVLYGVSTVLAALYLALTPDGPHRDAEWSMVVVSVLTTLGVIALPRRAIARSPRRFLFFVTWSAFSCVFVGAVAVLDGGLGSPLALLLIIPTTYASLAYPARAVVGIGAVAVASATAVGFISGNTFAETEVFVGTIGMVTLLSASVTRARREQQVARHELTRRLVELATHDGLTGCLNHRTFYDRVVAEVARAARHGHDIALLLLDIDDFKMINDTRGHLAGDEVLRGLGSALQGVRRCTDAVGRIGGDEFAVLLVEATEAQARAAAARFQAAVADLPGPVPVVVTVGMAHVERPGAELTAQQLVAVADLDLYARKHHLLGDGGPPQLVR